MDEKKQSGSKKPGQKFKSLLVWNILLKKTDESHALQIKEIVEFLSFCGISAERHSVKRDIDDLLDAMADRFGSGFKFPATKSPSTFVDGLLWPKQRFEGERHQSAQVRNSIRKSLFTSQSSCDKMVK